MITVPAEQEKPSQSQGSSLKIDAVLRMVESPSLEPSPQKILTHTFLQRRSGKEFSKMREGVIGFFDKRKDNSMLNVVVDILMVAFGLGCTAAIFGGVVWIIRLVTGTF
jgi:hypothetical protein